MSSASEQLTARDKKSTIEDWWAEDGNGAGFEFRDWFGQPKNTQHNTRKPSTEPPFSLFREYVAQLGEHGKQFLILGNQNAITYKEMFSLMKNGLLWLGVNNGGDKWFRVPDHYENTAAGHSKWENGVKYHKLRNIYWFTNLDHRKRHQKLPLWKDYTPDEYPAYDNYDAIEVGRVAEIPDGYDGVMGVPITFLKDHNPDQFEILGITDRDNNSGLKTKEYTVHDAPNPSDLNRRGVIAVGDSLTSTYARVLIRRRP